MRDELFKGESQESGFVAGVYNAIILMEIPCDFFFKYRV